MRSAIHLRLALGLLAVGSAAASPCKPISATTTSEATSAATSAASTETSLATSLASAIENVSATSSVMIESSVETSVTSAETSPSSAETSDTSVTVELSTTSASTELIIETTTTEPITTAAATTTELSIETTTNEPTTTELTTTAAETTSTAPMSTFTLFASGSNAVTGRSLQSYNQDGTVALFDPATDDGNPSARQYSIDSQGRLVNDQGFFLCGYYGATTEELDKPATVSVCRREIPDTTAFLTCELSGFEVQCSVPAVTCVSTGYPNMPANCVPTTGTWSLYSVGVRSFGYTWQIGGSDTPTKYERLTVGVRAV
ncbi:hypothetical protein FBEOM_10373 [Fusarium beomiforme]|uniref:Ig-like domain-containing protein n=1 Tax=Fusarium beomiforme TaxID=44412 RepID=A0A9P5AD84_9HYPO|nr:hypothetical protein FBEOM_10373 [Fusarium beomiforme]